LIILEPIINLSILFNNNLFINLCGLYSVKYDGLFSIHRLSMICFISCELIIDRILSINLQCLTIYSLLSKLKNVFITIQKLILILDLINLFIHETRTLQSIRYHPWHSSPHPLDSKLVCLSIIIECIVFFFLLLVIIQYHYKWYKVVFSNDSRITTHNWSKP